MKIAVIGGGPGGLFFSVLIKRADPSHDVTVFERNAPDATFGFGVVFPERSMRYLRDADEATHAAFTAAMVQWDPIEYRHRGRVLRCGGHIFSGIARTDLLRILQQQATALSVNVIHRREIGGLASLSGYDLIVAADGVNSMARREREDQFRPSVHVGRSRYVWLGTTQTFSALTFIFEQSEHGWFGAHIYPYSPTASTFIVETDEDTWKRAGFHRTAAAARTEGPEIPWASGERDLATLEYCERVFARHLEGHRLQANYSRWSNFRTVHNRVWRAGNVVVLGDAAHTAHFSVGSGTRMALEDAVALAGALRRHDNLDEALAAYEHARRPPVEYIQRAAEPSRRWWEEFRLWMHFEPEQFAFHHLARTRVLTYGTLAVRDSAFVQTAEAWFTQRSGAQALGRHGQPTPAALVPFRIRGLELANRIVGMMERALDRRLQPSGAGLVLIIPPGNLQAIEEMSLGHPPAGLLRQTIANIRATSAVRIGLRLSPATLGGTAAAARRVLGTWANFAVQAEIDALALDFTRGHLEDDDHTVSAVVAARAVWQDERPLIVIVPAWEEPDDHRVTDRGLQLARTLHAQGADLIGVTFPKRLGRRDLSRHDLDRAREAHAYTSDLLRNVTGVPSLLLGGAYTVGDVNAFLLAGRADLCEWPPLAWPGWRPRGPM